MSQISTLENKSLSSLTSETNKLIEKIEASSYDIISVNVNATCKTFANSVGDLIYISTIFYKRSIGGTKP